MVFQLAQFLHFAQVFENFVRLLFVEATDSKTDVDDDIVSDLSFGHVREARFLEDTAEIDLARAGQRVIAADAGDLTWNS